MVEEAGSLRGRSSLRVFARLDIGLMANSEGRPSYFINEVTQAPTGNLFLNEMDDHALILRVCHALLRGLRIEHHLAQSSLLSMATLC
jgi:hypothetical protein